MPEHTEPPEPEFRSLGPGAPVTRSSACLHGLGVGPIHLLTVRGSKSGRPHTVPVVPVDDDGKRWLVAPYGAVAWVHNARVAGRVSLRYGRTTRQYPNREVGADEAAPVLKRYVAIATNREPTSRRRKTRPWRTSWRRRTVTPSSS